MLKFDLSGRQYEGKKYKDIDYVGAKNNRKEQNKIIETYLPLIKNMSRIQQSIDEDLFQEQMMYVIETVIPSYDDSKGKFSTYLYTLLNNNKLNYIRDNGRRNHTNTLQTVSGNEDDARTLQDILLINEESPENTVLKEFEMEYLIEVVSELPERERKIINLYHGFEDSMTFNEIAKEIGYSAEYIRQLCHKAEQKIKEKFERVM